MTKRKESKAEPLFKGQAKERKSAKRLRGKIREVGDISGESWLLEVKKERIVSGFLP